jgi:hypothetical protein
MSIFENLQLFIFFNMIEALFIYLFIYYNVAKMAIIHMKI